MIRKYIGKDQALQKLKQYCAYQERCHEEVKEKSYSYGLKRAEVEAVMAQLIEEGYLNEERFAIQFAGGKWRMKQWGRQKIMQALKTKKVSSYCIAKAMQQIDETNYDSTLRKLGRKKWNSLSGEQHLLVKLKKTRDYLLRKGYEPSLIAGLLKSLQQKPDGDSP